MISKYLNPYKYWNKALFQWKKMRYDLAHTRMIERRKFDKAGFQYDESLKKLESILRELGKPDFCLQRGMGSIHWVLFCSISHVSSIENILEIGTFDGETAQLLSKIFPNSNVTTIDLPDDDPIFSRTYQREDAKSREEFRERQKKHLSDTRITFLSKNSFFLPDLVRKKFDLIWIDGGHLYPAIAWDICNAYHLCNPGGWIMCDDVITNSNGLRDGYVSPDSYEILEYIKERTKDEVSYFLKRESPEWSADPKKRKFVAVMRKS